jgi:dTDP-4-dehydrorhamnose 3,5-epimerase
MDIERTAIPGVLVIRPKKFEDGRGFFAPIFRKSTLAAEGVSHDWVQDNHSFSRLKGTVRGLHFQKPPFAQAKLVRVIRGAARDVCVDLRPDSPTYGRHFAMVLTPDDLVQLYIPAGFAHGFCTLADDTEVVYKVSEGWSPQHEGGLMWNDPALGIDWPVGPDQAIQSDRDKLWPGLAGLPT